MRLNGTGIVNPFQNRWELQGKEKESTFNLNRIDFGGRVYNPTIGRWDKIDNVAEKGYLISPYNYNFNNPINNIDPDGNWPWPTQSSFISKARSYVINKTVEATYKVASAIAIEARNQVTDFFKDVSVSPFVSIEAKSTTGGRVALGTKKGVEFDANVLSVDNFSFKGEISKNETEGSFYYLGKDNKINTSYGGSLSKGFGGAYKNEEVRKGKEVESSTSNISSGIGILGIGNISSSFENSTKNGQSTQTLKSSIGIGGQIGVSQVFEGEIKIGIKAVRKSQETD